MWLHRVAPESTPVILDPGQAWGPPAPELAVSGWLQGGPLTLRSVRGRVVVVHLFQLWCAGSNRFSLPLLRSWEERFDAEEGLSLVSVHSVFEGHDVQSRAALARTVEAHGITHAVGLDAYGADGDPVPLTLQRYHAGGTPSIAVIDRRGGLRFQRLGAFRRGPVERLIRDLLDE